MHGLTARSSGDLNPSSVICRCFLDSLKWDQLKKLIVIYLITLASEKLVM